MKIPVNYRCLALAVFWTLISMHHKLCALCWVLASLMLAVQRPCDRTLELQWRYAVEQNSG